MLLNVQLGIRHTGSGLPARAQAPSKGMAHSLSDLARLPEGASSRNPAGSFPGVSRLPRRHSAQPLLQIIIIALPCDPLLRTTTHWSRRDNARTRRRGPRATFGVAVRFKTSRMGVRPPGPTVEPLDFVAVPSGRCRSATCAGVSRLPLAARPTAPTH